MVHSFTVIYQNATDGFRQVTPYVLGYVELDAGPRVLTDIIDVDPEQLRIGQRVVSDIVMPPRADGERYGVLRFRPTAISLNPASMREGNPT